LLDRLVSARIVTQAKFRGWLPALRRGEYGIFVTTSYFTIQAQKEVLEDAYPISLFAGIDLVRFFRELKLIAAGQISQDWLKAVMGGSPAAKA